MKAEKTRFLLNELVKCGKLNADSFFLADVLKELEDIERPTEIVHERVGIQKVKNNLEGWREMGRIESYTEGSQHYIKKVQPIELSEANGYLEGFCISSILKYASRFKETQNNKELVKIVDYAQILLGHRVIQKDLDVIPR